MIFERVGAVGGFSSLCSSFASFGNSLGGASSPSAFIFFFFKFSSIHCCLNYIKGHKVDPHSKLKHWMWTNIFISKESGRSTCFVKVSPSDWKVVGSSAFGSFVWVVSTVRSLPFVRNLACWSSLNSSNLCLHNKKNRLLEFVKCYFFLKVILSILIRKSCKKEMEWIQKMKEISTNLITCGSSSGSSSRFLFLIGFGFLDFLGRIICSSTLVSSVMK